jgi:predicted permease
MWLRDLLQDLRFGVRVLKANPTFTTVAILTLALGIGANTAIFSVVNTVVLRFLPVRDAGSLIHLRWSGTAPETVAYYGSTGVPLSQPIFERLRAEREVFSDLVAYIHVGGSLVRHGVEPEFVSHEMVSGNYFSGLGVGMVCGRPFTIEDEAKKANVVVLSYMYWTRSFHRSCDAIGQTLYIKTVPYTIIGVTAEGFHGIGEANDVWTLLGNDSRYSSPTYWCISATGRLLPGVSQAQALAKLNPVFQRAAYDPSRTLDPKRKRCALYFEPARGITGLREDYRESLTVLLVIVGLVLVIACGNVAMLLTARNAARAREFSIRMALGGSRTRLFRQLLAESSLLVAAGGGLGWLLALWATDVIRAWADLEVSFAPDRTVLLFTMAVSILATILFGLVPMYSAGRVSLAVPLRTSSATAHQNQAKARGGQLVISLQISLCLVLLVASGLLVRTLRNLEHVDLGFRSSGLLVFGISPPRPFASDGAGLRFYQGLLERMRSLPGVESATITTERLGSGSSEQTLALIDGKNLSGDNWESLMAWTAAGPDFIRALGMRRLQGRGFNDTDSASAAKVAIVNQTFVNRFLHGSNALGHRIELWETEKLNAGQFTIVGVVADAKYSGIRDQEAIAYFPVSQILGIGETFSSMTFELRTVGEPLRLLPALSRAVREFDPDLVPRAPRTQQEQFSSSISQERLVARLALCFGFLAAVLVATGLYGTLAYTVSRRTAEIGLRIALGATRGGVLGIVIRRTLTAGGIGVAIGFPLAMAAGRFLRSSLYGLAPEDPLTFAAALACIVLLCVIATWIPARKAASVDPVVALRYE